jgi:hypothetical protein
VSQREQTNDDRHEEEADDDSNIAARFSASLEKFL